MPRQKVWLPRLVQIIEALEASAVATFARAEVETLFGIGRSAATDLMKTVGPSLAAAAELTVTRENLLYYLRNSNDGQNALAELSRRKRLASTLRQAAEERRMLDIRLPCGSADEWSRLQDLPNVAFGAGVLSVAYSDALDLFGQLYRLAKAAGSDWDAFVHLCEGEKGFAPIPPSVAGLAQTGENGQTTGALAE